MVPPSDFEKRSGVKRRANRFVTEFYSRRLLQLLSKEFEKHVSDECRYDGDCEVGTRKDIAQRPGETPSRPHARPLKLPHQKIGIEQENDERYFDHRSPDILFHGKYRLLRGIGTGYALNNPIA
jgi:hypothetical protein